VSGVDQNNILDSLDDSVTKADWVLIDVEGSANLAANYAIAGSDAVIIPAQKSQTDARQAVRAVKLVRDASKAQRRAEIPHALLFTRTSSIVAGVQRDVVDALSRFPTISVELAERSAYQAIFAYGGDLRSLPARTGGNVAKAIENAGAVTDAITALASAATSARDAA
jgi:chromosome partitioning protein